jgi:hypothetical protein
MQHGIWSSPNWKTDGLPKKSPNGLKKNILVMPCQAKPYIIMFFPHEGGVEKAYFARSPSPREKEEKGEWGGETGENTGNDLYRRP